MSLGDNAFTFNVTVVNSYIILITISLRRKPLQFESEMTSKNPMKTGSKNRFAMLKRTKIRSFAEICFEEHKTRTKEVCGDGCATCTSQLFME